MSRVNWRKIQFARPYNDKGELEILEQPFFCKLQKQVLLISCCKKHAPLFIYKKIHHARKKDKIIKLWISNENAIMIFCKQLHVADTFYACICSEFNLPYDIKDSVGRFSQPSPVKPVTEIVNKRKHISEEDQEYWKTKDPATRYANDILFRQWVASYYDI